MKEVERSNYKVIPSEKYFDDVEKHKKSSQKKLILKIISFLEELKEHPTTSTGKPEALKGFENRFVYSRRIDQKHRLVYEIFEAENRIDILSCYGHYDD